MPELRLNSECHLEYRENPWDERAFGLRTNEITSISGSPEHVSDLLNKFEIICKESGVVLTLIRIPADRHEIKLPLFNADYYYAETSVLMKLSRIGKKDFSQPFRNNLDLCEPDMSDIEEIREITRDSFIYGRFHEDPNFKGDLASHRHFLWVSDLVSQGKRFLVYKAGGKVISYMAYIVDNGCADLVLGGSRQGYGYNSPPFWASLHQNFKVNGIKRVKALISAANTGVMNIYTALGYKADSVLCGFHRLRQEVE